MNKTKVNKLLYDIFVSITMLVLGGCGTTSVQSPTPIPPYIHYSPPKDFNVKLEFDYPGLWVFSEEKQERGSLIVIGLGDPRFRDLATPSSGGLNRTPNDYGGVDIWVSPSEPGHTAESELELLKQNYKDERRITLLKDYTITINGYDAGVLEYEINDPESYTSLMFARRIVFITEDQLYMIYFTISEKDRGGEFEKGYEYFFKSLKIVQ